MELIGTVGLAGSGKGEFAAVAESEGIPVVTMGDVIRAACRERGLDPNEHHGEVAQALRREEGPAAIAERTLPMIEDAATESGVVLVDGIRSDVEVELFRERFGENFTLVSVEAPFELRKERIEDRGRGDEAESLAARDERELGFGLGEAMAQADITIENTDGLDAFRRQVREVLS
ncbi:MAG: AAA family ATPase [Natronomonas sp.]